MRKIKRTISLVEKYSIWWLILILFLSFASLRRKLLKTNYGKERSVHIQIQKVAIFESDRLKINFIHISQSSIFFDAFVYSWYFIIFYIYLWKHSFLFRRFLIMKTTFSYFPGMFENPAPAKYWLKTKLKILWNFTYIRMRRKVIDDFRKNLSNVVFFTFW